jgi:HEAT repeat protein
MTNASDDPWRVLGARRRRDAELLREIASDQDALLQDRTVALYSLGKLHDAAALELATSLVAAEEEDLRSAAVAAVAGIASPESLATLTEIAEHEPVDYVRWQAYPGLARIGGARAAAVLIERLGEPRWWGRRHVSQQLARIHGPEARAEIRAALRAAARAEWRPLRKVQLLWFSAKALRP